MLLMLDFNSNVASAFASLWVYLDWTEFALFVFRDMNNIINMSSKSSHCKMNNIWSEGYRLRADFSLVHWSFYETDNWGCSYKKNYPFLKKKLK